MIKTWMTLLCLGFITTTYGQSWSTPQNNPEELGDVNWLRNYDIAIKKAQKEDKPVFILFQEVPGCATCRNYGNDILSDPLIVEAIESHFIPLCIYNNVKGHDRKILERYNEPTWNNPVARVVDKGGIDITDRLAGNYSKQGVLDLIVEGIQHQGLPIPTYINHMQTAYGAVDTEELVVGMYCFWSGEKAMAQIPGVVETQAGFMNGREVVVLKYDKDKISGPSIISKARAAKCADIVYDDKKKFKGVSTEKKGSYRKDRETKYYLYNSPYRSIPMTKYQQLQANRELSMGGDIRYLLSPRQQELWMAIQESGWNKNNIDVDLSEAWREALSVGFYHKGE